LARITPDFYLRVVDDDAACDVDPGLSPDVLALARIDPPEIVVRDAIYRAGVDGSDDARLILAHELGHIWLLHGAQAYLSTASGRPQQFTNLDRTYSAEWKADEFAAELMMPGAQCRTMSAVEISDQYGVPLRVAEWRRDLLRRGF